MQHRIDRRSGAGRVLIVGGGLVGLSAAVFLARRGVPVLLVERHAGSSLHPRAIGFTTRTTEIYRAVGLGSRMPQAPRSALGIPGSRPRRVKAESLAGKWSEETPWTPNARLSPAIEYSPCTGTALTQDRLEPILRERATELGADIRLETELVSFEQDGAGVTARLRGRDRAEYELRADFLVAADGHRSPIRESLGIARDGRGHIVTGRSVLFRAPLEKYLEAGVVQFEIEQPDFKAFLTTYKDGRWVLMGLSDEERDDDTLRALVTKATLDLFDGDWVLLTEDERWRTAAAEASKRSGVLLRCVRIGGDLVPMDPAAFRAAFAFGSDGASLVRPDGYVAWRATTFPANAVDTLTAAVVKVASATTA